MSSHNSTVKKTSQVIPWEVINPLRADLLSAIYPNGKIGTAPYQKCVGHTSKHDIVEKDGCWLLRVTDRKKKGSTQSSGGKTRTCLKGLIHAPVGVKTEKYSHLFEYRGKEPPKMDIADLMLMASEEMHARYYKRDASWVCSHTCHRNNSTKKITVKIGSQSIECYDYCIYPPHLVAESEAQAISRDDCCGPRNLSEDDIRQGAVQCSHSPQCCLPSEQYFVNNHKPMMYYSKDGTPTYFYRQCWDKAGKWNTPAFIDQYPTDIQKQRQLPYIDVADNKSRQKVVRRKIAVTKANLRLFSPQMEPTSSDEEQEDNESDDESSDDEDDEEEGDGDDEPSDDEDAKSSRKRTHGQAFEDQSDEISPETDQESPANSSTYGESLRKKSKSSSDQLANSSNDKPLADDSQENDSDKGESDEQVATEASAASATSRRLQSANDIYDADGLQGTEWHVQAAPFYLSDEEDEEFSQDDGEPGNKILSEQPDSADKTLVPSSAEEDSSRDEREEAQDSNDADENVVEEIPPPPRLMKWRRTRQRVAQLNREVKARRDAIPEDERPWIPTTQKLQADEEEDRRAKERAFKAAKKVMNKRTQRKKKKRAAEKAAIQAQKPPGKSYLR